MEFSGLKVPEVSIIERGFILFIRSKPTLGSKQNKFILISEPL